MYTTEYFYKAYFDKSNYISVKAKTKYLGCG